jgi:hypothetical protein
VLTKNTLQRWSGSMVWEGASVGERYSWVIQLSEYDLDIIQIALQKAKLQSKPLAELTAQDFDFKDLGRRFLSINEDLLNGPGFVVLRGLPVDRWSHDELVWAYWAIGAWFGSTVPQNARADLLGHVIDQRMDSSNSATRIYQTNRAQPFHSDSCDIVGLLCLRQAKRGGCSSIASAASIHNKLLDCDRSVLEQLYDEFLCDRYDEIPAGKQAFYPVHIFNRVDEQLVCCGMDPDIRSAQRLGVVRKLSVDQVYALDKFQEIAKSLSLEMMLQPGDIQLVNNLTVVHAREAFDDYSDPAKRRYMVRLWLSSPRGRALPKFLVERWGNLDVGTVRGGIRVPGATPTVNLNWQIG